MKDQFLFALELKPLKGNVILFDTKHNNDALSYDG